MNNSLTPVETITREIAVLQVAFSETLKADYLSPIGEVIVKLIAALELAKADAEMQSHWELEPNSMGDGPHWDVWNEKTERFVHAIETTRINLYKVLQS